MHVVVKVNADKAKKWSDKDVLVQLHKGFKGILLTQNFVKGEDLNAFERQTVNDCIAPYWYRAGKVQADLRPTAVRQEPANKLSDDEEKLILATSNEARFTSLPPSQIVPTLLDEGVYIASESSFYRVLKANAQLNRRGRSQSIKKEVNQMLMLQMGRTKCGLGISLI
ncbi:hypothetical protein SHLI107390_13670 [Shewanella livingstonensis]